MKTQLATIATLIVLTALTGCVSEEQKKEKLKQVFRENIYFMEQLLTLQSHKRYEIEKLFCEPIDGADWPDKGGSKGCIREKEETSKFMSRLDNFRSVRTVCEPKDDTVSSKEWQVAIDCFDRLMQLAY